MTNILIICGLLTGLALVFTATGVILVWNRRIKDQTLSRHALLAALVTTGSGYWLMRRPFFAMNLQDTELFVSLGLVLVLSYILFWTCIDRVLASFRHSDKFKESSVLSMLYMPSEHDEADFPETQLMQPNSRRIPKDRS